MHNSDAIVRKTQEYYQSIKEGHADFMEATNKVVELNLPLVTLVVRKYKPYSNDQFQTGCLGLINAARTYNLDRNVPFASYAIFCIERELHKAFRHSKDSDDVYDVDFDNLIRLDSHASSNDKGDMGELHELIMSESASLELDRYIRENELTFMCEQIIRPSVIALSPKQNKQTTTDVKAWQKAEFLYIMDLVFIDSQKQRITLEQVAKLSKISIPNAHAKHNKVMEEIFQRMWCYMTLSFNELFVRLRGDKKVPERLLVFDPGQTTGWCLFEKGQLTRSGQLQGCYDDKNINVTPLLDLFNDIKPDFILYEDYKVYAHKLERHTFNPVFTLRLIGTIETYSQMNKIPTHKQMATTAKGFCTDEKLKCWGFWQTGHKHARDAIRHGCYFLLFYKKGANIIEKKSTDCSGANSN